MNYHPTYDNPTYDNQAAVQECVEIQTDGQTKSSTSQNAVEYGKAKDIKHSQHNCHISLEYVTGRSKRRE